MKILLVEDDQSIADGIIRKIRNTGIEVEHSSTIQIQLNTVTTSI